MNKSYVDAMHAVQTGVAMEIEQGLNNAASPKHLRVGVNSALIDSAALVNLLVRKGVFTGPEFLEELRIEANREVERYEKRLTEQLGVEIHLG